MARIGDYIFGDVLGTGGFATVAKCHHVDNPVVQLAVKSIDVSRKTKHEIDIIEKEVHILHKLNHPNIVHMYDAYFGYNNIYIFTELMRGGELYDKIMSLEKFDEAMARRDLIQICSALNFCHRHGVAHRDVKPENILISGDYVKLADFGLAEHLKDKTIDKDYIVGTPLYLSPEVILNKEYTFNVDVWSVGIVAFIILSGLVPFSGETNDSLFAKIVKGVFSFKSPMWDNVSPEAKDFIRKALTKDPKERPQMCSLIKHDWLKGNMNSDLSQNLAIFKEFNAKRKLKKAFCGIRALQRIKRGSKAKKEELKELTSPTKEEISRSTEQACLESELDTGTADSTQKS